MKKKKGMTTDGSKNPYIDLLGGFKEIPEKDLEEIYSNMPLPIITEYDLDRMEYEEKLKKAREEQEEDLRQSLLVDLIKERRRFEDEEGY